MFFIPLNQIESVELVIHALRAAAGEADCSDCPVRRVCMKQCLSIAEAVSDMAEKGTLPALEAETPEPGSPEPSEERPGAQEDPAEKPEKSEKPKEGHLKVVK